MRHRHARLVLILLALFVVAPVTASAQAATYSAASDTSRQVGERYMAAYLGLDWETLESLLADEATFEDPTAAILFRGSIIEGREAMMANFRTNYAGLELAMERTRTIFAGNVAVFEGTLTWSFPMQGGGRLTTEGMPIVVTLLIEGGKVVEHRDYADYRPYLEAVEKAQG